MPLFGILYFVFVLSNFGFPGTVNFVGEFLITSGGFEVSNVIIVFSLLGMILTLVYSLFFYNRMFFLGLPIFFRYYSDCIRSEIYILVLLFYFVLLFGFFPEYLFSIVFLCLKKIYIYLFFF